MRYPDGMTLRPIQSWPGPLTTERRAAPFTAGWATTLDLLDRELRHLGDGRQPDTVLQVALREQDLRLDGLPRASAVAAHPGVILSIESGRRGTLSFPCDTFLRWQDNVRAIALTLEALRKIDRYGVTQTGQQYTGWQQLAPSPPPKTATVADALDVLARAAKRHGGNAPVSLNTPAQLYRLARAATHPDRNNDDRTEWDLVEDAAAILRTAGQL